MNISEDHNDTWIEHLSRVHRYCNDYATWYRFSHNAWMKVLPSADAIALPLPTEIAKIAHVYLSYKTMVAPRMTIVTITTMMWLYCIYPQKSQKSHKAAQVTGLLNLQGWLQFLYLSVWLLFLWSYFIAQPQGFPRCLITSLWFKAQNSTDVSKTLILHLYNQ